MREEFISNSKEGEDISSLQNKIYRSIKLKQERASRLKLARAEGTINISTENMSNSKDTKQDCQDADLWITSQV